MVFARTKLTVEDSFLKPQSKMEMRFSNINAEKLYHEIPKLLSSVFRVDEKHIQEKRFSWTHGEPQNFKVVWDVNKEMDAFSAMVLVLDLEGSSSKGMGNAAIVIEGYLRTEYPQDTFWQRSLLYEMMRMFWHKAFYVKKRMEYLAEGRRRLGILIDSLKKLARG